MRQMAWPRIVHANGTEGNCWAIRQQNLELIRLPQPDSLLGSLGRGLQFGERDWKPLVQLRADDPP
jgi:hypothetical protein